MLFRTIPLLFLALINLIIAGFVVFNKKHLVNKLFAIFICFVVGWILSLFAIWLTFGKATNLFWGRVGFAPASLAALSFLWFAEIFPDEKTIVFKKRLAFFTFLGLIVALLSFSPAIVSRLQYVAEGQYQPVPGLLYHLFTFHLIICFGYAFFILGVKWRRSRGVSKLQIQYLFLGIFLFCVGAITNNVIVPYIFNVYRFTIYGPYFTLFLVGFTAHAIIRYRLMDVKVVVSKSVAYSFASVVAIGILFGLFCSIRHIWLTDMKIPEEALFIASALGGIIVFFPLKRLTYFLLNKYLYRETVNLQRAMRDTSQALVSVLEQDELLDYLGRMIVQKMKVESAFIFLREKEEDSFCLKSSGEYFNAKIDIPESLSIENSIVLQEIERRVKNDLPNQEKFLVREELSRQSEDVINIKISEDLAGLNCDVVFPIVSVSKNISYGELTGMLCIGPKLSGDPYFQDELDLFSMVANQASIAIENAQLYAEINFWKEYNESVLANMESGVITIDTTGLVVTFNEGAERLTGTSREQIIGKDVTILGPNISTLILSTLLHCHELKCHNETVIKTPDNRSIPIILSTSLLRNKDGEILGSLMVFSDISQIKELEEEKRKMERLATMGSLAAGLTHEIKNSLVPLKTFAELLPEHYSDPEFRESFGNIALQQINEINELVSQLRDLAHPPSPHFAQVKIDLTIENVLKLLSGKIKKTGVSVIKDYTKEAGKIWADESQLRQLFLNLIMNSLQAMPQGGKLYIKTYMQPSFNNSHFMYVEIKDTGKGIAAEDIEKIFNPFFTTKEDGIGMGLTVCRNIVDLHKGTIEIDNNETGKGVTVTLSFPIRA